MARTPSPRPSRSGYSLVELLVVLAIVAILAIAGVSMLGNRGGNSVRVVMDELEGAIMDAHKYAASTGNDVAIVTWGQYQATGTVPTLYMARGLTSTTTTALTDFSLAIQDVAINPPAAPTAIQRSVAVLFAPTRSREYMNVGVVVNGANNWWTNAMLPASNGRTNVNITDVEPIHSDTTFQAAYTDANNLFQGTVNQATISGANKRFTRNFSIKLVSTAGGFAVPGGAMGLIVVLNNGSSVYKFYNSGVANGDGQWRRI